MRVGSGLFWVAPVAGALLGAVVDKAIAGRKS
jgi:hypothetical protein